MLPCVRQLRQQLKNALADVCYCSEAEAARPQPVQTAAAAAAAAAATAAGVADMSWWGIKRCCGDPAYLLEQSTLWDVRQLR
jgi:hypothetical protein